MGKKEREMSLRSSMLTNSTSLKNKIDWVFCCNRECWNELEIAASIYLDARQKCLLGTGCRICTAEAPTPRGDRRKHSTIKQYEEAVNEVRR